MMLSGVLFDMDGLLVDTEPLWMRAEQRTMTALGGSWTAQDQRAVLGGPLPHAARYMAQRSGTDLPDAQVARMLIASMADQLRSGDIPLRPGARELVCALADRGVPRALVSASLRVLVDLVLAALAEAGVPAFPVTIAGDEVPETKPDPAPYRLAARRLGIEVTRSIVLEDSPNGVRAGRASGATVVAVPHLVPIEPRDGVVVLGSLAELDVDALDRLVTGAAVPRGERP